MVDKKIDTLLADIYTLLLNREDHILDRDDLDSFGDACIDAIRKQFTKRDSDNKTLRMSNIGRKDRQLWYDMNYTGDVEPLASKDILKFLYGDLVEALMVFLIKESGHTVSDEQLEVEVDGIKGHIDCKVDGELVDVKSASPFGFKKFKDGSLLTGDDPFGYLDQLSGYSQGLDSDRSHFLAVNKVDGSLALLTLEGMELEDVSSRIEHLKEVVANPDKPERCYAGTPEGKKGNLTLNFACGYCSYKDDCWSDCNDGVGIRYFQYAQGPKGFVKVTDKGLPRVKEVLVKNDEQEIL